MELVSFKWIGLVSMLFNFVNGTPFIETPASSLQYDFRSGEPTPIVDLITVTNIGFEKAIFAASSDTEWIFVYRQYQDTTKSVTLPIGSSGNFIVEIHPEQALDGPHEGNITLKAVHLKNGTIFDSKDIQVGVDKNVPEEKPLSNSYLDSFFNFISGIF